MQERKSENIQALPIGFEALVSNASNAPNERPRARLHWRRAALALGAFGLASLAMGSGYVKCPTAALFHVPCPGCGSTRSMHALLTFDLEGVFRYNPLAPLGVVVFVLIAARVLFLVLRDGHAKTIDEERIGRTLLLSYVAVAVAEIVLWVVRFFGVLGGPCPV